MAIFTSADLTTYAPTLSLTEPALSAAIAQAQFLIESPVGANRILEIQQHVEVAKMKTDGVVRIKMTPLVSVEEISCKVNSEWVAIASTDYQVDLDLGEISVESQALINLSGIDPWGISSRRSRPTKPSRDWDVRVKYTAGFDFTVDTTEVVNMKAAIAGIIQMRQSKAAEGIQSYEWNDWYKVSYGSAASETLASGVGSSPFEDFLLIFRRYRPREVAT